MTRRTRQNSSAGVLDVPPLVKTARGRRLDAFNPLDEFQAAGQRRLIVGANTFGTAASIPGVQTAVGTHWTVHPLASPCSDLTMFWGNFYTDHAANFVDTTPTTTVTFRGAVVWQNVVYPLTFGGKREVTLDGGGGVWNDPFPVTFPAGTNLEVRTYVASGSYWATHRCTVTNGSAGGFTANTDLTATGSAAVTAAAAWQFGPMAICGTVDSGAISVLLIGDSITHGFADGSDSSGFVGLIPGDPYRAGGGWLTRGLLGKAGIVNVGISSDAIARFALGSGHNKRLSFARHATAAIIAYGRNDVSNQQPYLDIGTNNLGIARGVRRRGLRIIMATVMPRTSSTDNWATSGGQLANTAAMETIRVAYNTWMRAGCPMNPATGQAVAIGTAGAIVIGDPGHPVDKVWDVTAMAETSLNSGLWKPADRVTTATVAAGSASISSAVPFTDADIGKTVTIPGAGPSGTGFLFTSVIRGVSNGVATVNSAATNTVTGGTCVVGAWTFDGVHPNPWGALQLSSVVNTNDLALVA